MVKVLLFKIYANFGKSQSLNIQRLRRQDKAWASSSLSWDVANTTRFRASYSLLRMIILLYEGGFCQEKLAIKIVLRSVWNLRSEPINMSIAVVSIMLFIAISFSLNFFFNFCC